MSGCGRRDWNLGPPVGYPVQFRVTGTDPSVLRQIAGHVAQVMRDNPHLGNISNNWGNLGKSVQIDIDQDKARLLGLSSQDISQTMQTLLQGVTVTQYRENLDLIPVVMRAIQAERREPRRPGKRHNPRCQRAHGAAVTSGDGSPNDGGDLLRPPQPNPGPYGARRYRRRRAGARCDPVGPAPCWHRSKPPCPSATRSRPPAHRRKPAKARPR